jgi:hypothetical protein
MLIGRSSALDIVITEGRRVARRYKVHALVISNDGTIEHVERSDAPAEEVPLPMTRDDAREWILEHFEDFVPDRLGELMSVLVRPTGPLV